jgi:hypothetical protein
MVVVVMFVVEAIPLGAQSTTRRVCVLPNMPVGPTRGADYSKLIVEILEPALKNAGFDVVPADEWGATEVARNLSDTEMIAWGDVIRLSDAVNADLALTGFHRLDGERLIISLKCYDVANARVLRASLRRVPAGLATYNTIQRMLDAMLPAMRGPLEPLPTRGPASTGLIDVTLRSPDEGAEIVVNGREVIGTIEGGLLRLQARTGEQIDLEVRKAGYYARSVAVILEGPTDYDLEPLEREETWGLDVIAGLDGLPGLGVGGRYYLNPGRIFVGAETYVGVHRLRVDNRLLAGLYLFGDPYSRYRGGVSAGAGIELTDLHRTDSSADVYLNPLNLWVERTGPRSALWLRIDLKWVLDLANPAEETGWNGGREGVPLRLGLLMKR